MCSDQLDLIIKTEEIFRISFEDSELAKVRTVGEYYQLILSKLTPADSSVCRRSYTFFRIRKEIMSKFGLTRSSLKYFTRMDSIIPRKSRALHWKSLQDTLMLKLPDLKRPKWMMMSFAISFFLMLVIGQFLHFLELILILPRKNGQIVKPLFAF